MKRHPWQLPGAQAIVHRRDLPGDDLPAAIVLALLYQHPGGKLDPLGREGLGDLRRDLRQLLLGRRGRGRRRHGVGVRLGLLALGVLGGGLGLVALKELEDAELGGRLRRLRRLRGWRLLRGRRRGRALPRRHG